jgi:hypothetical protein
MNSIQSRPRWRVRLFVLAVLLLLSILAGVIVSTLARPSGASEMGTTDGAPTALGRGSAGER